MQADLPFKSEYAKTGRAGCKGCKMPIAKDSLRIARMVQSAFHDGKQPNWFHEDCLFRKLRPSTEGDIAGFDLLRNADQLRLREKIGANAITVDIAGPSAAKKKSGKKRAANGDTTDGGGEVIMTGVALNDYGIEYAVSSRATCVGCQQKISKSVIRVKKVVYDTEVGMKYGGQPLWHHLECFEKLRIELGWYAGGDQLPGFKSLSKDDQKLVTKTMPPVKSNDVPQIKKIKSEDQVDSNAAAELEKQILKQNARFHKNRDLLAEAKPKDLKLILEKNKQKICEGMGQQDLFDAVADIMTFGAMKSCTKCNGQFVFNKSNYICTGDLSEWVKCEATTMAPERRPCKMPSEIVTQFPSLKKDYRCETRALRYVPPSTSVNKVKKEDSDEPRIKRDKPPLYLMEFAIIGKTEQSKDDIKLAIQQMGGKLGTKIHNKLAAIISNQSEVEKMNQRMEDAKGYGIQVVTEEFLKMVTGGDAIKLIKTSSICDWGTDPASRIPQEETFKSKSKSLYTKSVSKSVKLNLKNGTAVDPESGLVDTTHVYIDGKLKYFAILCNTDIQRDRNSYYKIQLLESDNKRSYFIFRSWGRIGTSIGDNKLDSYPDLSEAIHQFRFHYKDKTSNEFGAATFQKKPGRYYLLDVDFGDAEKVKNLNDNNIKSNLSEPVQELMKLLFNVETMKKVMLEFDLDMEKMPLGKLSQKQLTQAMQVLNELSDLIKNGGNNSEFIGKSNHFYNLVPHDFGIERAPIIDTIEQVSAKTEMIEALMEIEIAYGLLQTDIDDTISPLDGHYEQLKTDLQPLQRDTEEFKLLKQYVENTHAETHRNFDLEIEDIFKVARKGEDRRYKPFRKLHNRKLLWHGSRLTNFVGILSHGLKIAPPEAPVTGYMFGKGIYFADMVSKSANYCCTSSQNNTGLMLLCEVALGDMMEYKQAHYVTQLPKDKHSVKGIGKTCPNPIESHKRADGVEIPLGKPVTDTKLLTSLLYNEYIVYDVSQLNVQYMFKLNFKHKF